MLRSPARRFARRLPCGLLVLLASACAGNPAAESARAGSDAGQRPGELAPAVLVLRSQLPGPVAVYATRGELRVRVATVTAWRTVHVRVPEMMVGRGGIVQLLARPIGDRVEVKTDPFSVDRGDRVSWTLIEPIERSDITLRITRGRQP